jgi:hydroxymethylglutaryl-CoA synthase
MAATVGIDTLAIYTSRYAMELAALAQARGMDADKYHVGLGQFVMSVPPPGEDVVTMAANAAQQALQDVDLNDIEMLLFATESGIDQSKAAGIYVHGLLGLPARCRVLELKQACYSGTAAIQLALSFIRDNPSKKVLVIASDIARYGLGTTGESSQGSGAVALVLSAQPRVLVMEPEYGVVTENVMDFWRPNYSHEAFVDGKYSSKLYLTMLEKCWEQYKALSHRHFQDHAYFCYHTPVPRLVEKAHQHLLKCNQQPDVAGISLVQPALAYGRQMGNSYSASLYVGLASLLDNAIDDLAGQRVGFYSYGSGCVAEFFSGIVQSGYKQALHTAYHQQLLATRKMITHEEYEHLFNFKYVEDGSEQNIPVYQTGSFRLSKMQQHKRIYEKTAPIAISIKSQRAEHQEPLSPMGKVYAPGKLILSGEHAVVYGQPALAMAINRYVTATVTRETETVPQVLFDLSDLSHRSGLSFDALRHLKNKIKQKYYRFISGDYSIREVLQKPFELAQFAMGVFTESLNLSLPHGVKIQVQSDLPIGCGMGSSAATILSVMQAISNHMQLPITQDTLYQMALEAENMQHGHSSGLDLRIAMQGGCIYMQGQTLEARPVPALPMYLVNTGTPVTTTGQCIEKAAPLFKSQQLCDDFASVTNVMDEALQNKSWAQMRMAIQHNHQLLVKIGVVPARVQSFINQVEANGGVAKLCGAGAVSGDHAGAVLVVSDDKAVVTSLASRFGYNVIPISAESRGVHAA